MYDPSIVSAGELNQRITIEAPPPPASIDAYGQRIETWSPAVTVWAKAEPLRGRELFAAGAMNSETSVRFRIRWRAGLTGAMRVRWRGAVHAIVSEPIDVGGKRRVTELMCAAGIRDEGPSS